MTIININSRFSLNGQNVMTPTDGSVTSTGNSVLSTLDIQKVQCLYYCDGTSSASCGGHKFGDSGTVEASGAKTCKTILRVEDGSAIQISFSSFQVSFYIF